MREAHVCRIGRTRQKKERTFSNSPQPSRSNARVVRCIAGIEPAPAAWPALDPPSHDPAHVERMRWVGRGTECAVCGETNRNQPFGWFPPGRTAVPHGKPQRRGVGESPNGQWPLSHV